MSNPIEPLNIIPRLNHLVFTGKKSLLIGSERSGKTYLIQKIMQNKTRFPKVLYVGKEDEADDFCDTLGFELLSSDDNNPVDARKRAYITPDPDIFPDKEVFFKLIDMYAAAGYFLVFDAITSKDKAFISAYTEKINNIAANYDNDIIIVKRYLHLPNKDNESIQYMDQILSFKTNTIATAELLLGKNDSRFMLNLSPGEFFAFCRVENRKWGLFPGTYIFHTEELEI